MKQQNGDHDPPAVEELNHVTWWKLRCPCGTRLKLFWLGLSFLVLFSPFQATQILVSSLYKDAGLISLFLLYVAYAVSAVLAPLFVETIGLNASMFFASLLYVLWIAGAASGITPLFLVVSFLNGFGGGPIWVSSGVRSSLAASSFAFLVLITPIFQSYIQRIASKDKIGRYTAIFFAMFFTSIIIGNLLTGSLLWTLTGDSSSSSNDDTTTPVPVDSSSSEPTEAPTAGGVLGSSTTLVLWILCAVCGAGSLIFLFLPPVSTIKSTITAKEKFKRLLKAFIEPRSLWLMPYFFNSGTSVAFAWGLFPRLMELKWVPFNTVVYGAGLFIASMSMGPIFDKFGWKPLIVAHCTCILVTYPVIVLGDHFQQLGVLFAAAFLLGCIEALTVTISSSIIIKVYGNDSTYGFAVMRSTSGLGIALIFLVALGLVYQGVLLLLAFIMIVSVILLSVYMIRIRKE